MAKSKTEKAKSLLNPQPKAKVAPRGSTAAQIEAMKKAFGEWQNETYETCLKEIDKLEKGWLKQYSEWQKTEQNKLKDC